MITMTNPSDSTPPFLGQRAVVLGASIAGLLAARALAGRFAEVLLLERDELPLGAIPRKGTPQAIHPHGLLAKGREVLESLFPGFTESLVRQGAILSARPEHLLLVAGGRRFARGARSLQGIGVSRLAIEAELRRRVLALPSVRAVTGVDVRSPVLDAERQRVVGVAISHREGELEETLAADLVVDCTGRGSRAPSWLTSWGYDAPDEERVEVGIRYVSAYFRRGAHPEGFPVGVICSATAQLPRPAVMIAQEPGTDGVPRWVVGVGGYAGDHGEATLEGLRRRAREIGCDEIVRITHDAEPLGDVVRYRFPYSQRRRYERLARFPGRFLLMGDALTSFNPIYGQGMTTAACEALALGTALDLGLEDVHRRFLAAAARVIDTPWQLAVGADLAIPAVRGERTFRTRLLNGYIAWLQGAAEHDAHVALAFVRVVHLVAPPESLVSPGMVARVLWQRLRRARASSILAADSAATTAATAARSPVGRAAPSSWTPSAPALPGASRTERPGSPRATRQA